MDKRVMADTNKEAKKQQPVTKKLPFNFSNLARSQQENKISQRDQDEAGPSRILDDSAIISRGPTVSNPEISLEDITETDTDVSITSSDTIEIVANINKEDTIPCITLSSDSSMNISGNDTTLEASQSSNWTPPEEVLMESYSVSSDSALPRS